MKRKGGSFGAFITGKSKVKCNGCTACCKFIDMEVFPHEDVSHLDIETKVDGTRWLKHKPDGSCIHLGDRGCTVYKHRPEGCRNFDCRFIVAAGLDDQRVFPEWNFSIKTPFEHWASMTLKDAAARNRHLFDPILILEAALYELKKESND